MRGMFSTYSGQQRPVYTYTVQTPVVQLETSDRHVISRRIHESSDLQVYGQYNGPPEVGYFKAISPREGNAFV